MATTTPGTDLVPFDQSTSNWPALFSATQQEGGLADLIRDNLGDDGFDPSVLDKITVAPGGIGVWALPDDETAKEIVGVPVLWTSTRAYFAKAKDDPTAEDNQPPDCASADAKHGTGTYGPGSERNPSGLCENCPMNEWATARGGTRAGKACSEQRRMWIMLEGSNLPVEVQLAPSSLKAFRQFMARLIGKGVPYYGAVVSLGLTTKLMNGNKVSVLNPKLVERLAPEEAAAAQQYGTTIQAFLQQAALRADAADEAPQGPAGANDVFGDDIPAEYADDGAADTRVPA